MRLILVFAVLVLNGCAHTPAPQAQAAPQNCPVFEDNMRDVESVLMPHDVKP